VAEMSRVAHAISEVTNVTPSTHQPYVRVLGLSRTRARPCTRRPSRWTPCLYQHIDPGGGRQRHADAGLGHGGAVPSVEIKGKQLGYDLSGDKDNRRPGGRPGQGTGKRARIHLRGRGMRPSSCCCGTSWRVRRQRHFPGRVLGGHRGAAGPGGEVVSEATVKLHAKGERIVANRRGATGPSTRWTRPLRVGPGGALPGAGHCWSWRTTRCAIPGGLARDPARSPGCSSSPATATGGGRRDLEHGGAWTRNIIAAFLARPSRKP